VPASTKTKSRSRGGLTVKKYGGLNKTRYTRRKNANFGKRLQFDGSAPVPTQFLGLPSDDTYFKEFDQHQWQEGGRWYYVPCLGDACPLCQSDDSQKSRLKYRFVAVVYNHDEKKVQILEGPMDLAQRIGYRYERSPNKFLKRVYDVSKLDTQPVKYDVNAGDDNPLSAAALRKLKLFDLDEYIDEEAKRYFGDELPKATSLDADDEEDEDASDIDDDDDDEEEDEQSDEEVELREELEDLDPADLKRRAKSNGATAKAVKELEADDLVELIVEQELKTDDDEDDDEDEDDVEPPFDEDEDDDADDDEDDEDDEPPAPKKSAKKKAPARKSARSRK
jgi:hypothetical protein